MLVLLLLQLHMLLALATPLNQEWAKFKHVHGKKYASTGEERHRLSVYLKNKRMVEEHNAKYERNETSFRMALNRFADTEAWEWEKGLNEWKGALPSLPRSPIPVSSAPVPKTFDWRDKNCVVPVKDQGFCNYDWAFSAVGALESAYCLKNEQLVALSEQNIIDCCSAADSCLQPALSVSAFQCAASLEGVDTEASYPYKNYKCRCNVSVDDIAVRITSYQFLTSGDENALQQSLVSKGPISVSFDGSQSSFRFYSSGVYYDQGCGTAGLQNALLVGYGESDRGEEYWIVKNSWGTEWGEGGYIKMARGRNNQCGIATLPVLPSIQS